MPALLEGHKTNYETLLKAAKANDLALMNCTDKQGNSVAVLCAVNHVNGEYEFVPIAKLFNGNPYDELNPPTP